MNKQKKWQGQDIVQLRASLDFTQEELAERLGVTVGTVKKWERGRSTPNRQAAILMEILGDPELRISVTELLEEGKAAKAQFIGCVPVDSGQLVVVDPCHLADWKGGDWEEKKKKQNNDYGGVAQVTMKKCHGEYTLMKRPKERNHLVATITGGGDGLFPVFAVFKYGELVRLEVRFGDF